MTIAWVWLIVGIAVEAIAATSLRFAVSGSNRWYALTGSAYPLSFVCLAAALQQGMALAVAYGVWAASGIALATVCGRVFFHERISPVIGSGLSCIIIGVILIEAGSR